MLSVGAIRFEDRFCASRKGGMRGGGGCHPEGDIAWRLLQLAVEKPWSVLGWAICLLSCTNGRRKPSFHLVGTPFLAF